MTVQRYTILPTMNPLCPISDCSVFCFPEINDYLCIRLWKTIQLFVLMAVQSWHSSTALTSHQMLLGADYAGGSVTTSR